MRAILVGGLVSVLVVGAGACGAVAGSDAEHEAFFREKVRPILSQRCWECHGEDVQESSLRLDSRTSLLAGGSSGETVAVPGKPAESYLITVLRHGGDVEMPPDEPLPDEEIETLRRWIQIGLPWPAQDSEAVLTREERYAQQLEEHWAFQPVAPPALPPVKATDWVRQPLDRFILARLESEGLTPSPEADRYTLMRRLKVDLLGLPPTCAEIRSFVEDASPDAYEKLVDRYLASPRYGERWGRHWLDVARYADTRGYAFGRERRYPYAYTYRDYVIDALNDDVPYDQFILEQLAADQLCAEPNDPKLAALGFLTVGRKYNNRHLDIDDQIDVVGRGLLGLTLSCARCHDHKYDPVPTEDYYSLYGVFASSAEPAELPTVGDPAATPGYAEFKQELDRRRAALEAFKQKKRDELVASACQHATDYFVRAITRQREDRLQKLPFIELKGEQVRSGLVRRWRQVLAAKASAEHPVLGPLHRLATLSDQEFSAQAPGVLQQLLSLPTGTQPGQLNPLIKDALATDPPTTKLELARRYGQAFAGVHARRNREQTSPAQLPDADRQVLDILVGPGSLTDITLDQVAGLLDRAERNRYRELERKIQAFQAESPAAPPRAMVVRENPEPHNPRVFVRGNHRRPGKSVPRQPPLALAGFDRQPFQQGSGRLELARQIVSADNPLTARVAVNRVWMHHFGRPLVPTPSDFGLRCARPIQADTLDFLAHEFVAGGWSLKELHRTLVLSATYRQRSVRRTECAQVDPENRLYWRMNARRLEFEAMRDAVLFVAGRLDTAMGGRPVDLTKQPAACRRAVYGFIDRQDLPGLFRVFDLASPDQSCPQRPRTTVPQQALYLMNSEFILEQAGSVAARPEIPAGGSAEERIAALYQVVLARSPSNEELELGKRFLAEAAAGQQAETGQADCWQQYAQLLIMSNAFMFVD